MLTFSFVTKNYFNIFFKPLYDSQYNTDCTNFVRPNIICQYQKNKYAIALKRKDKENAV